jgi:hypothetical protein
MVNRQQRGQADGFSTELGTHPRPDRDERNLPAVEELWEWATRRYAIERTRVDAFEGQIANQARIVRLLVPVKIAWRTGSRVSSGCPFAKLTWRRLAFDQVP